MNQIPNLAHALIPPQTILNVDLYGTALVLEEFGTSSLMDAPES